MSGCVCTQYWLRAGTVAPTGRVICSLVCVHVRARGPGAGGAVFGVEVCVCVAVSVCGVGVLGVGPCRVCILEDIVMQSMTSRSRRNVRAIFPCARFPGYAWMRRAEDETAHWSSAETA